MRESFVAIALTALLMASHLQAAELDKAALSRLDAYISHARASIGIPGVSVAVVQHGVIVFEKGYGVREAAAAAEAVTPHTVFRIASASKPLGSLLVARLVDRGVLDWDTRVQALLPGFRAGGDVFARELRVQDLLCLCSGLPETIVGTDLARAALSPEALLDWMGAHLPTAARGERLQYSNESFAAGVYVAVHAAHPDISLRAAYDRAIASDVLVPLGMTDSGSWPAGAAPRNAAQPHAFGPDGSITPIALASTASVEPVSPAGGLWSSAHDMARYLLAELANGRGTDGRQLVSSRNMEYRRQSRSHAGDGSGYGLGIDIAEDRDVRVLGHTGGIWGYGADVFFVPAFDAGAVVLANLGPPFNPLVYGGLRHMLIGLLLGTTDSASGSAAARQREFLQSWREEMAGIEFNPDATWVSGIRGVYEDAVYGEIRICPRGGVTVFDAGPWQSTIGRRFSRDSAGTLVLTSPPWLHIPGFEVVTAGGKRRLRMDNLPAPIEFTRVRACNGGQ